MLAMASFNPLRPTWAFSFSFSPIRNNEKKNIRNSLFSFWGQLAGAVSSLVGTITGAVEGGRNRGTAEKLAAQEANRKAAAARLKSLKAKKANELTNREKMEMLHLQYLSNTNIVVGASVLIVVLAAIALGAKKLLKK